MSDYFVLSDMPLLTSLGIPASAPLHARRSGEQRSSIISQASYRGRCRCPRTPDRARNDVQLGRGSANEGWTRNEAEIAVQHRLADV